MEKPSQDEREKNSNYQPEMHVVDSGAAFERQN